MSWATLKAAELYACSTFELCNVLREIHNLPTVD